MAFEGVHAKVTTTIYLNACGISRELRVTKSAEFQVSEKTHEEAVTSSLRHAGSGVDMMVFSFLIGSLQIPRSILSTRFVTRKLAHQHFLTSILPFRSDRGQFYVILGQEAPHCVFEAIESMDHLPCTLAVIHCSDRSVPVVFTEVTAT